MKNVIALVDLHSSTELGPLTENRPLASTTILGRYTFIDFALSNLTNSGIDNIGILIKDHSRSIIKHLGGNETYLRNPKTGFQSLFINEKGLMNPQFNTDINNIRENDWFLYDKDAEYIVVVPVQFVMKMDFNEIINEHIKSNKECSVVYRKSHHAHNRFIGCDIVNVDILGNVQKFETNTGRKKDANISLEVYVFNKAYFKHIIDKAHELSSMYSLKDVVHELVNYQEKVNAIEFEGYCRYFGNLQDYKDYSFELLDKENHVHSLFNDDWPFYTRTHNSRPVLYGLNAEVKNSILANGCSIDGKIIHSVIARNVTVEQGATVENCIIFTDCVISSGTHLKNCIVDKHCKFKSKKKVEGKADDPLYIPQGEII